jgi:cytochrome oxidase Cu insertion factor (SCO1/SenC/PrrC family)
MPALVLMLWTLTTLWWWAFAFVPLPSEPPAWLSAARYACFGALDSGLPEPQGWMLLIGAPLTLLAAVCALWGRELLRSVTGGARSTSGKVVIATIVALVVLDGAWVSGKVSAARAIARWDPTIRDAPAALPAEYSRGTEHAPDFALVDQHGRSVALRDMRGRPVIVTFVFAHCQALCPLVLQTVKTATTTGAPEVLAITLDPWRDTPGALPGIAREWTMPSHFHVLSSSSADDVTRVVTAFGVPFERDPLTGDIAHPGLVFVVDRAGRLAYTFNNPSATWIRDAVARLD